MSAGFTVCFTVCLFLCHATFMFRRLSRYIVHLAFFWTGTGTQNGMFHESRHVCSLVRTCQLDYCERGYIQGGYITGLRHLFMEAPARVLLSSTCLPHDIFMEAPARVAQQTFHQPTNQPTMLHDMLPPTDPSELFVRLNRRG
jgi:hypothetical protein